MDNLGERGDVVNVAPGYARNYLFPKEYALPATPGNMKVLEQRRRIWEARETKDIAAAKEFAAQLEAVSLSVAKKSGEGDTLYGSVTNSEIAELLHAKGMEVDRRKIVIDDPIKTLGSFTVHVKLHKSVIADVAVSVVAEEGE
jgi:large subunit ribosomal protein L9